MNCFRFVEKPRARLCCEVWDANPAARLEWARRGAFEGCCLSHSLGGWQSRAILDSQTNE